MMFNLPGGKISTLPQVALPYLGFLFAGSSSLKTWDCFRFPNVGILGASKLSIISRNSFSLIVCGFSGGLFGLRFGYSV